MSEVMDYLKPIPRPSDESKPYWEGLRAHRLLMPQCTVCRHRWFPPSRLCPACHADAVDWVEVSGRGKIFSYVVFHRVYHPGFKDEVPYAVALIELEEGPRLLSNVVGLPLDEIVCEMPVRIVYDDITETVTLPKFARATA
jgi:hypothetical protein